MVNGPKYPIDGEKSREQLMAELVQIRAQLAAEKSKSAADAAVREFDQHLLQDNHEVTSSICRAAPIGIGLVSNRTILDVNDKFCEITGYSRDELTGKNARMLYPSEKEFQYVGSEKYRQIAKKGTGTVETRLKCKDGRIIDVLMGSAPLDLNDLTAGATFTVLDITERKKWEDALRESEKRYRSLFYNNHAIMLLIDPVTEKIVNANDAACEYYGYTREEITGLKVSDINMLPADQIHLVIQLAQAQERRRFFFKHRLSDGRIRDVEVHTAPFFMDGQALLLSIIHDITERKTAEETLRESEAKNRSIFQGAPIGIGVLNNRIFVEVNDQVCEITGYATDELIGKDVRMVYLSDDEYEYVGSEKKRQIAKRGVGFVETRLKRKDGRVIDVLVSSTPFDQDDQFSSSTFTVMDITDRKRAEEKLLRLNETLEHQVAERTGLAEARAKQLQKLAVDLIEAEERERRRIADLLHDDLQQMIASARMQVQSAIQKEDPIPVLKNVDRLLGDSIEKSRRLSHELSPPVLYQFGLAAALNWLVRHMDEQFGLKVQLDAEIAQTIEDAALRVFLFHATQELLFNCVKYAGVKRVGVYLYGTDLSLTLCVRDHGKGFDPEILNASIPKLGLGLTSLQERTHALGGKMVIESAPGQGSRFTLTIPIRLPEARKPEGRLQTVERQIDFHENQPAVPDSKIIRVLFADDHKVLRQGLIGLVTNLPDIEVVGEAANGEEALERARQLRPDLVVMDISMPRMDGIESTRLIKAEMPEIRVIGLSMFDDADAARKMRKAGAEAFVSKSESSDELVKAIYGIYTPGKNEQ